MTVKPVKLSEKLPNSATDKPMVSIIIGPHGGTHDIERRLTRVLNGSAFNFELILPKPQLSGRATEVQENNVKIRYILFPENSSGWEFFNYALKAAAGKYISFMPGDDIPEGSDHLVKYLEVHPNVGYACNGITVPPDNSPKQFSVRNLANSKLKIQLLQSNPYVLPFMLFRKSLLAKKRLTFNRKFGEYAFYDFMAESSAGMSIHILREYVIQFRTTERTDKSIVMTQEQHDFEDNIRLRQLKKLIGNPGKEALALHLKFMRGDMLTSNELTSVHSWLQKLLSANEKNMQLLIRSDRSYILNALIEKFRYTSYLEIGVFDPKTNFDNIACKQKTGVDPEPLREDITGKFSDDFFADLEEDKRFDLIFIDGLHHSDQVSRDISNALKRVSLNGTIVCHDMLPEDRDMQTVPRKTVKWMGDCWKSWARLRMTEPGLEMHVIDCDCGVGIIRKGEQVLFGSDVPETELDYDFFEANRNALMNVITVAGFYDGLNRQKVR